MPGQQKRNRVADRPSPTFSRVSDVHDNLQVASQAETHRSSLLRPTDSPAKFDTQVASLPVQFQAMTRIAGVETPVSTGSRTEEDNGEHAASQLSPRKSRDQRGAKTGDGSLTQEEQPVGLVVALFQDGFVCRHVNKENECVEGFAQPYDTESSYFLACIDNGRVPEGLPDMIACAHYNGSVLAEIRDYRDMGAAMCPVSSAFLPGASALPQVDGSELDAECCVWQALLLPGKCPSSINAHVSQLFEPPTLQSMFDHFPGVTPGELETLAMDAKRQLLHEEDMLLSSSSTESSPRDESRVVGFFPTEPEESRTNGDNDGVLTTTPTTRSRFLGRLAVSPPASYLSPIERKSARASRNGQENNSAKRCKRQIQTKAKGACNRRDSHKSTREGLKIERSSKYAKAGSGTSSICHHRGYSDSPTDDSAAVTPLPATQLFLSRLKGKRRRPDNELLYGKPAWVTLAHVGRFFRAATRLEREHSRFLHVSAQNFLCDGLVTNSILTPMSCFSKVNARRLMQVEKPPPSETEHVAGSMRYLARQLGNLTRPSDVIAVAGARELKAAEDEGRELVEPDWTDYEEGTPAETSIALVAPDSEPALHLQHIDTEEDVILGGFLELSTETTTLVKDYQPTAAAPHFNTFDDDGNL